MMGSTVKFTAVILTLFQVLSDIIGAPSRHDVPIACDQSPVPVQCVGDFCEAFQVLSDMKAAVLQVASGMLGQSIDFAALTGFAQVAFSHYVVPSNLSSDSTTVRFYMYSDPENPTARTELILNDVESIERSGYDKTRRLIMLTHGFQGDTVSNDSGCVIMKNAYLATYASVANIVLADWSDMSGPGALNNGSVDVQSLLSLLPTYALAARNVYPAATRFSAFLKFLFENLFVRKRSGAADIHLIGHSLGAHVMALGALEFYNETSIPIFWLTGTEPAGPLFLNKPTCQRFSANLAQQVDSIHTNVGEFGIPATKDLAKIRILVNGGGLFQPWCLSPGATVEAVPFCSHEIAPKMYALSLKKPIFGNCVAGLYCRLQSALMGEKLSNCALGQYNVKYTGPL